MVKVLSLNIRVWTRDIGKSGEHWWVKRYRGIREYIGTENPDVICLQEVWWPAKYVLRLGKLGYKRTGWGFSHPIYARKGAAIKDSGTSVFATTATVDGVQYFSVHAHWKERYFQRAMRWIAERRSLKCVCAGDFNTSDTQKLADNLYLSSARVRLGLSPIDTFTNFYRPKESHGEIDHVLTALPVVPADYRIGPYGFSDHRPVIMEFGTR